MKIHDVFTMAAQGDVLFRKIKAVPKDYEVTKLEGAEIVVAHSETGHHHVAVLDRPEACTYYTKPNEPFFAYVVFNKGTHSVDIVHNRDYDTHESLRLKGEPGSVWQITRQREHTPEGWRREHTPEGWRRVED